MAVTAGCVADVDLLSADDTELGKLMVSQQGPQSRNTVRDFPSPEWRLRATPSGTRVPLARLMQPNMQPKAYETARKPGAETGRRMVEKWLHIWLHNWVPNTPICPE